MSQGRVTVRIQGDNQDLDNAFSESEGVIGGFASFISDTLVVTLGDVARIIGKVIDFMKKLFEQYDAQIVADIKLSSAIRATGEAAGFTAGELKLWANQMQETVAVSDQAIQSVQALLLQFKDIRGDVFERATKAVLEFSATTDTDLRSATRAIARALEDPIQGMERLDRVAINLTETQRKQIIMYAETGQKVKAQTLLLDELATRQQATEELAQRLGGRFSFLGIKIGELAEKMFELVGTELTYAFVELSIATVEWLVTMTQQLQEVKDYLVTTFKPAIDFVTEAVLWLTDSVIRAFALVLALTVNIQETLTQGFEQSFDNAFDALKRGLKDAFGVGLDEVDKLANKTLEVGEAVKDISFEKTGLEDLGFDIEQAAFAADLGKETLDVNKQQLDYQKQIAANTAGGGAGGLAIV